MMAKTTEVTPHIKLEKIQLMKLTLTGFLITKEVYITLYYIDIRFYVALKRKSVTATDICTLNSFDFMILSSGVFLFFLCFFR